MLDRLSKKILKYMLRKENPSNTYYDFGEDLFLIADAVSSDAETVRAAVDYLESLGYIHYHSPSGILTSFLLAHKGLHYMEYRRLMIQNFWFRSIFTPILVAFATSILTVNLWPALRRLL